jgi:ABC-type uncharacterized transport system ATPase component
LGNGANKSALLNILAGETLPSKGQKNLALACNSMTQAMEFSTRIIMLHNGQIIKDVNVFERKSVTTEGSV